jgi:DNA-binding transcriptional regulator LsrR (DeoR family)
MVILCDLMLQQASDRALLLDRAPFVRVRLAKRFGVSRVHVNRLFREAEQRGYLSFDGDDWVVFSPEMSEDAERHYALTFQVMRIAALTAL